MEWIKRYTHIDKKRYFENFEIYNIEFIEEILYYNIEFIEEILYYNIEFQDL